MNIKAYLNDSKGQDWPILAMALHMEVGRFPRMYAQVEGQHAPSTGALTFMLTQGSTDVAALTNLSRSTWYVCASQVEPWQGKCLLTLMPDPACTVQLGPFAANGKGPASLLAGALAAGDIEWDGDSGASIEAFVSLWETPELLARRVARLTNETFRIVPGDVGWRLMWGGALPKLMQPDVLDCTKGVFIIAETSHALEQNVQCVTVPADFDKALLESVGGDGARSYFVHRPVQLGYPGATAVAAAPPANAAGAPLRSLIARWYALTDASALDALWRGAHVGASSGTGTSQDVTLSSLFLYDGLSSGSRIGKVSQLFAELLGGVVPRDHFGRGWAAYVLAVPVDALPREVALVDHLLELHRVAPIWQALTQRIGCGTHDFEARASTWPASLPALAVNNPKAPDKGTVSLTADCMGYRTKIWVRVLGVQGDVEVDWATPFASHNTATGGGGDLLLVPEANTLGYVSFLGGQGAPYFHLSTHYRDVPATPLIIPGEYKHGLVTDKGLYIEEKSQNVFVKVHSRLTLKALKVLQSLGH